LRIGRHGLSHGCQVVVYVIRQTNSPVSTISLKAFSLFLTI
jgi:hypothetical protein